MGGRAVFARRIVRGGGMKWWKKPCDEANSVDMRELISMWGWDWYGRYDAIIGMVGQQVSDQRQTFALQMKDGRAYPLALLAKDLGTNVRRLTNFCRFLADRNLIDKQAWDRENLIFIPRLELLADEYIRKLRKKSRQTPDNVRLEESRTEENKEDEKKREGEKSSLARAPSADEVKGYFLTRRATSHDAEKFFPYYKARDWRVRGEVVTSWQALADSWIARIADFAPKQSQSVPYRPKQDDPPPTCKKCGEPHKDWQGCSNVEVASSESVNAILRDTVQKLSIS